MRRSLAQIDEQYRSAPVDPWGVDWRASMSVRNRFYQRAVEDAVRGLPGTSPLRILDVGCGSGILSERLYQAVKALRPVERYLAVDVSAAAIDRAREMHAATAIDYETVDEGLTRIGGSTFDLVVGFEFLPYLDRDERAGLLQRLSDLLAERGVLILSSNVRSRGCDQTYLSAFELGDELEQAFRRVDTRDLFLSSYIDGCESRLLRWSQRRIVGRAIQRILAWAVLPAAVEWMLSRLAGADWPRCRNRVFIAE